MQSRFLRVPLIPSSMSYVCLAMMIGKLIKRILTAYVGRTARRRWYTTNARIPCSSMRSRRMWGSMRVTRPWTSRERGSSPLRHNQGR